MNYGFTCFPRSAILIITILCLLASADEFQQNAESAPKPAPQTPEQTEADRLDTQVVQLLKEMKYQEALPLAKRAVELREKSVGPEHKLTVVTLQNLGAVDSALNKHSDGAKIYRRVLKIQEKLYGESNAILCDTLSKLGWELLVDHKSAAALEMFDRGLKLSEAAFGIDAKETVPGLRDLITLYESTGQYDKSISYFQRFIAIREKQLGENHPDVAALLLKCANLLRGANRKAEADDYKARARKIYNTLLSSGAEPQMIPPEMLEEAVIFKAIPLKQYSVRGEVKVRVTVDEAGIVTEAIAISGPNELRNVSEKTARRWRFKLAMIIDRPKKVMSILTFRF